MQHEPWFNVHVFALSLIIILFDLHLRCSKDAATHIAAADTVPSSLPLFQLDVDGEPVSDSDDDDDIDNHDLNHDVPGPTEILGGVSALHTPTVPAVPPTPVTHLVPASQSPPALFPPSDQLIALLKSMGYTADPASPLTKLAHQLSRELLAHRPSSSTLSSSATARPVVAQAPLAIAQAPPAVQPAPSDAHVPSSSPFVIPGKGAGKGTQSATIEIPAELRGANALTHKADWNRFQRRCAPNSRDGDFFALQELSCIFVLMFCSYALCNLIVYCSCKYFLSHIRIMLLRFAKLRIQSIAE